MSKFYYKSKVQNYFLIEKKCFNLEINYLWKKDFERKGKIKCIAYRIID